MKCNLCNKNEQCSCRGWGCPNCHSTRSQIQVMNDLLKFWISKDTLHSRLVEVHSYTWKIDSYTLYEYINWDIDKTKLDWLVEEYKPAKTPTYTNTKEYDKVTEFKPTTNPEEFCVFESSSPWARCIHCNSVQRYMKWKQCLKYLDNNQTE